MSDEWTDDDEVVSAMIARIEAAKPHQGRWVGM